MTISEPITLNLGVGEFFLRHIQNPESEGVLVSSLKECSPPVLIRIHSSCLFSEALGSTDCDCADQLTESLRLIAKEGGAVLYLYDEGRGIGLKRKLEAIRIQKLTGCDTVAAFARLGLQPDPRSYKLAAEVLLAVFGSTTEFVMITNNPRKLIGLRSFGLKVVGTRPMVLKKSEAVASYLAEKVRVLGHVLDGEILEN